MRRVTRLRRSDCSGPGFRRLRRGRGVSYLDAHGEPVTDEAALARIRELVIPPAWRDVWICTDPQGHLQATGTDAAGRKQYLYHARWRELRDREKFDVMLEFAGRLPKLRRQVAADLAVDAAPGRERVLAGAVRLLDVGLFRIGNPEYADEDGGLGLSTVHREHVEVRDGTATFDFPAKSGVRWSRVVRDPDSVALVASLKRRRGGPVELLAYRDGRGWHPLRSGEVNDYIKRRLGEDFSAKDFRTWNGTVLAAVALANRGPVPRAQTARTRAAADAARQVAAALGNTPAVARRSYIDPGVFDRFQSGQTITPVRGTQVLAGVGRRRRALEREVLALLTG